MRNKAAETGAMYTRLLPLCSFGCVKMQSCACAGTSPGYFLSVNTAHVRLYDSEDCKSTGAISSLITPEIEHDGTPAFLALLSPY